VGNFAGEPMHGVSGVTGSGPLWRQVMLAAHPRGGRLPPWPPGMQRRLVCPDSGRLSRPESPCPAAVEEFFAPGTAPQEACPLHAAAPPPEPAGGLRLVAPLSGAVYALDPDVPAGLQVLAAAARAPGPVSGAAWRLDGRPLARAQGLEARLPLTPGRHRLEVAAWGPWGRQTACATYSVIGHNNSKQ
jgi:penicillin-binding protein 1C